MTTRLFTLTWRGLSGLEYILPELRAQNIVLPVVIYRNLNTAWVMSGYEDSDYCHRVRAAQ